MTILPKIRVQYGEGVGNEIFVQFPDLRAHEKTYFDADEAAGQTVLSANGAHFSASTYIVLGQSGVEKTEIALVSGTPTSSAITVSAGTTFAHNRGDVIRFIPYNQVVIERSTDAGANYTPLSAINIRPDAPETYLQRTSDASTDVYRARFYNATDATYSQYSAAYTASGIGDNTFGALKRRALNELGEKPGDMFNDEFLKEALKEARREVDQDPRVRRFSFRTKFNVDAGDIIPGRYSVAAPSDLRTPDVADHILGIRLGRRKNHLDYIDLIAFQQRYRNSAHTTLNGAITTASTSIVLTSSGDFDESGAVDIAAESISEEIDNVDYTTNTESTATLGTVTNIDNNHADGRDVWQGVDFGEPQCFTIYENTIYFDQPFSNDLAGENIWIDYYQTLQDVTNDSSTLDEPDYDMYTSYLKWKVKYKKSRGTLLPTEDPDYAEWIKRKEDFIKKQTSGQYGYFVPIFS